MFVKQQAKVRKFGPKILQLLTEWTETFPLDFRDEKMVGHLKDIIRKIAPCDEVHSKFSFFANKLFELSMLLCSLYLKP